MQWLTCVNIHLNPGSPRARGQQRELFTSLKKQVRQLQQHCQQVDSELHDTKRHNRTMALHVRQVEQQLRKMQVRKKLVGVVGIRH